MGPCGYLVGFFWDKGDTGVTSHHAVCGVSRYHCQHTTVGIECYTTVGIESVLGMGAHLMLIVTLTVGVQCSVLPGSSRTCMQHRVQNHTLRG